MLCLVCYLCSLGFWVFVAVDEYCLVVLVIGGVCGCLVAGFALSVYLCLSGCLIVDLFCFILIMLCYLCWFKFCYFVFVFWLVGYFGFVDFADI